MKKFLLAAALFALTASSASAYTAYLKPDEFWPRDSEVAVEGAFASTFFTPQVALPAESFALFNPQGARERFDRLAIEVGATRAVAGVPTAGTYRISTGEQLGPVVTLVADSGTWRQLGEGETPAPDAQTTTLQQVTQADLYVTRGQPTRQVVDQPSGALAIHPVTHPNQVLAAQGMEIELLFNGAPLANSAVVIYAAGEPDTALERFAATNEAGRVTLTFPGPGTYLIAARHRAAQPEGSPAAVRSYTTTLTIEAYATLPQPHEINTRPEPSRRRWRN